ncbi:MAG: hypothetical protein QXI84_10695 [Thermofilaceae archaeon]
MLEHLRRHFPNSKITLVGWSTLRDLLEHSQNQPQEKGRSKDRDRLKHLEPQGIGLRDVVVVHKLYATNEFTKYIVLPPVARFGPLNKDMLFHVVLIEAETPEMCIEILNQIDKATDYLADYPQPDGLRILCDAPPKEEYRIASEPSAAATESYYEAAERYDEPPAQPAPTMVKTEQRRLHPLRLPPEVEQALADEGFKEFVKELMKTENVDSTTVMVKLGTIVTDLYDLYRKGKLVVQKPPRLPEEAPPELEQAWGVQAFRELAAAVFGVESPRELMAKIGADNAVKLAEWFFRNARPGQPAECPKVECPKAECPAPNPVDAIAQYYGLKTPKERARVEELIIVLEPLLSSIGEVPEDTFAKFLRAVSKMS